MKKSTVSPRQTRLRLSIVAAAVAVCGATASVSASAGLLIQMPAQSPAPESSFSQSRVVEIERHRKALDLNSRLTANITQEGTPPIELPPIRGMGVDVTLSDALKQIVPGGWKVFTEGEVAEDTLVSWQGNRTWPMALNTVLIPSGLKAVVDWSRNEVTLSSIKPQAKPLPQPILAAAPLIKPAAPAPAALVAPAAHITATPAAQVAASTAPAAAASVAPAPAQVSAPAPTPVVNVINQIDEARIASMVAEKLQKASASQAAPAQPAPKPASPEPQAQAQAPASNPAPSPVAAKTEPAAVVSTTAATAAPHAVSKPAASKTQWRLSKEKFLRENLRDWAASEGWELQWDAVIGDRVINYPVNADATLEGDLIGAGGVMDRVISKFERADEPLGVRFYRGNKVVVVFLYSANTSTFTKQTSQSAE